MPLYEKPIFGLGPERALSSGFKLVRRESGGDRTYAARDPDMPGKLRLDTQSLTGDVVGVTWLSENLVNNAKLRTLPTLRHPIPRRIYEK